jgi:hypothetical protein
VGHASRSSGLLHVKASLARLSQFDMKTGGGATVGEELGRRMLKKGIKIHHFLLRLSRERGRKLLIPLRKMSRYLILALKS